MKQTLQQVLEKHLFELLNDYTYTWMILDVSEWLRENGHEHKTATAKLIVNTFLITLNPECEEVISTFINYE